MSEPTKNEPVVNKEARSEANPATTYTFSQATALDQINISIKFKSRDHRDDLEGKGLKPNTDLAPMVGKGLKPNTDLSVPVEGGRVEPTYVTREQFDELKEQVQRLTDMIARLPKSV